MPRRYEDEDEDDYRPSRRYDDEYDRPPRRREYDDEEDYRSREREGFRCPYCRSTARPYSRSQISPAGWAVFAIMLFICTPLFFIGLLMTEEYRECADCGRRLS
jgi:hypothetical protein